VAALAAIAATALAGTADSAGPAGWKRTDLRPVTQPVSAGGRLLLYAGTRGGLELVALDPRSGATVWTRPATPSATPPGTSPALVGDDRAVVYMKRVGKSAAIAAVDPRDGKQIWSSEAGLIPTWPQNCPDDASRVCVTAGGVLARLSLHTPKQVKTLRFSTADGARGVGDGLFDAGGRKPERLVATRGATVAWSKPLASIFDVPGATTDWGWGFDRFDTRGLFVGSVGWNPISEKGGKLVFDLARTMTVGFRIRDGKVVWRDVGSSYVCPPLPCAGRLQPQGRVFGAVSAPRVGVRMRVTGTLTQPPGIADLVISPGTAVKLEGFDVASGRTRWTFDAGRNVELIENVVPPQTGESTVILEAEDGSLVSLDLASGARQPVDEGTRAWCLQSTSYTASGPTGAVDGYRGERAIAPCDARGRPAATGARVPAFVGRIGTTVGGVAVWAAPNGVFAAPVASG
jgi:hypothetical protein